MSNEPQGFVTHWIGDLKAGDGKAAQRLWERYFDAATGTQDVRR